LLAITGDVMAGNERLARSAAAGDVLGYLVTDPADPLSRTRDQIERYGATDGVVGAKIHCQWSRTHTAEHQVSELFAVLAGWGRPVKIHIDGADWDAALATLAMRHPALKIIVAHTGPGLPSTKVIPLASRHENLFIEFSSSMATPDVVRRIAAKVPREQVLFGTDAPLLSVGASLGTYLTAGLGPDVAPEVYTTNWRSVFG
jgi:predicted TIM-barrel fold metal-dependent hydrolase